MKIANQFTVSAPIEQAWDVLCDLEQVIPLMPGAQLTGHEGEDYSGKVKVKVGPVTSEFSGKVRFVEQDRGQHRAVIDAKGKETRGTGNAAATVTAQLQADGDRTSVTVDTDLKIVGKLAQFGSGMLQQVSEKLLGQFVESLEAKLAAEPVAAPATPEGPPQVGLPRSRATRPSRSPSTCSRSPAATSSRSTPPWCWPCSPRWCWAGCSAGGASAPWPPQRCCGASIGRRSLQRWSRGCGMRGCWCPPAARRASCRRCETWRRTTQQRCIGLPG